jgi:hypothetical protein
MKLEKLREHYYSSDNGKTWRPKEGFNSIEEVEERGLGGNKWRVYSCGHCSKLHVAKANRKNKNHE